MTVLTNLHDRMPSQFPGKRKRLEPSHGSVGSRRRQKLARTEDAPTADGISEQDPHMGPDGLPPSEDSLMHDVLGNGAPADLPQPFEKQPPDVFDKGIPPTPSSPQFQYSIPIPSSRSGKRVYPLIPLACPDWTETELTDCYDSAVQIMKALVDNHQEMRDQAHMITYRLSMVGTASEKASPSIIISTKSNQIKTLRALFNGCRTLGDFREARKSNLSRILQIRSSQPTKPPFVLTYFAVESNPVIRSAMENSLLPRSYGPQSLCGKSLRYQDRIATLALVLVVGSMYCGLTVSHLFIPPETTPLEREYPVSILDIVPESRRMGMEDAPEKALQLNDVWVDDYDTLEDDDMMLAPISQGELLDPYHESLEELPLTTEGRMIKPPNELSASAPYLDWALILFQDPGLVEKGPNVVHREEEVASTVELVEFAEKPRQHGAPVFIVSGRVTLKKGFILSNYSYLGSRPGQDLTRVWEVIPELNSSQGLSAGDSGSIVVDEASSQVYGHVVGLSPSNHAYVVPLVHTIDQIKTRFGETNVRLPGTEVPFENVLVEEETREPTSNNTDERAKERPAITHAALPSGTIAQYSPYQPTSPTLHHGSEGVDFDEHELVFMLTEIVNRWKEPQKYGPPHPSASQLLFDYIRNAALEPVWDDVSLPAGRTIAECKDEYERLRTSRGALFTPSPRPSSFGPRPRLPRASESKPPFMPSEPQTQTPRMLWPKPLPPMPTPSAGSVLSTFGDTSIARKKRGRPSKKDMEERRQQQLDALNRAGLVEKPDGPEAAAAAKAHSVGSSSGKRRRGRPPKAGAMGPPPPPAFSRAAEKTGYYTPSQSGVE